MPQVIYANAVDCATPPMPDSVFGLTPLRFDWHKIAFRPETAATPPLNLRVATPFGDLRMTFDSDVGYHIVAPAGVEVIDESPTAVRVSITEDAALSNAALSESDWEYLYSKGWQTRVGDDLALYVSIPPQRMYVIQGKTVLWQTPIATSRNGAGQVANSMQTPLGWHRVAEKFGEDAAWGQVFRSRAASAKIWDGQEVIQEGLVLTRILWLEGLEEGFNKGKNEKGESVDSKERYIYIHGTNKEHCIGTPMSDGCVNMYNDDVIKLYGMVPVGVLTFIGGE